MNLNQWYLLLLTSFGICFSCEKKQDIAEIDVSESIVIPNGYIIPRTMDTIIIDGLAKEKSYALADFTSDFIDIEGIKIPKYKTRVKMLWDSTYLYVFAELEEPHIWATLKKRDTVIFYNNDFEIFIDPSNTTYNYGEIEINALNTVWDLRLERPYRAGVKADNDWNLKGLKSAVNIYGTLNNPKDIDSLWTLEIAIPLVEISNLKETKEKPKPGEQWRLNFSRVEWDFDIIDNRYSRKKENDKFLKEYNWVWSNQKVINMHEPEKWGYVEFSIDSTNIGKNFQYEEHLIWRQIAYALYRDRLNGSLKDLDASEKTFLVYYEPNKTVYANYQKTEDGYTFSITNPETNTTYTINHKGFLDIHLK